MGDLNKDVDYFKDKVATAKNIVMFLCNKMTKSFPEGAVREIKISHYGSSIFYRGEKV